MANPITKLSAALRTSIVGQLKDAASQIADKEAEDDRLREEKWRVKALPEHNDDRTERAYADLGIGRDDFPRLLKADFASNASGTDGRANWAGAPEDVRVNFLALPNKPPLGSPAVPTLRSEHERMPVSVLAITWLLHDEIKRKLPALIDELYPEGRNGIRAAERKARLDAIAEKRARLAEEIAELRAALDAVKSATA